MEILKFKEKIQIIMHQRNEAIQTKDHTKATCNMSIQAI